MLDLSLARLILLSIGFFEIISVRTFRERFFDTFQYSSSYNLN